MNMLQKLILYVQLKRKNVRHAFCTAFCDNNKLTFGDWYFILLVAGLILIAVTLHYAEVIDNTIDNANKRAESALKLKLEALNKLHDREKVLITMLNSGYVRIDGRLTKMQKCDRAGHCE